MMGPEPFSAIAAAILESPAKDGGETPKPHTPTLRTDDGEPLSAIAAALQESATRADDAAPAARSTEDAAPAAPFGLSIDVRSPSSAGMSPAQGDSDSGDDKPKAPPAAAADEKNTGDALTDADVHVALNNAGAFLHLEDLIEPEIEFWKWPGNVGRRRRNKDIFTSCGRTSNVARPAPTSRHR